MKLWFIRERNRPKRAKPVTLSLAKRSKYPMARWPLDAPRNGPNTRIFILIPIGSHPHTGNK